LAKLPKPHLRPLHHFCSTNINNKLPKPNSIIEISVECPELADKVVLGPYITTKTPIRILGEDLEGIKISFKMITAKFTIDEAVKREDFVVKIFLKDKFKKIYTLSIPIYFSYGK